MPAALFVVATTAQSAFGKVGVIGNASATAGQNFSFSFKASPNALALGEVSALLTEGSRFPSARVFRNNRRGVHCTPADRKRSFSE